MTSKQDAVRNLRKELDKLKPLRDDEKAWRAQTAKVDKADDELRKAFQRR